MKKLFRKRNFNFNFLGIRKIGYAVALVFTVIGYIAGADALKVIDFAPFQALVSDGVSLKTFFAVPDFSFLNAAKGFKDFEWSYLATVAVLVMIIFRKKKGNLPPASLGLAYFREER